MVPRTMRGWLAVTAWVALLLFVLLRCQFALSCGTTEYPMIDGGSRVYFSVDFWGLDRPCMGIHPTAGPA